MRATYRIVRVLAGLLLLALSVSWLLLRRRRAPVGPPSPARRLTVVPAVTLLDPPRPDADEPAPARENGITPPLGDIPAPRVSGEANGAAAGAEPDDLRAIKGIGPATESALHELGIRTFRQLAVLDGAAREELRVALKDTRQRMEREDWVGQAAELHRAKYGEDPLRSV